MNFIPYSPPLNDAYGRVTVVKIFTITVFIEILIIIILVVPSLISSCNAGHCRQDPMMVTPCLPPSCIKKPCIQEHPIIEHQEFLNLNALCTPFTYTCDKLDIKNVPCLGQLLTGHCRNNLFVRYFNHPLCQKLPLIIQCFLSLY